MYDVAVVGAGPAGCTAARALAKHGCRVLMVEKCKMPREKSCSGILIKKSMELVESYFGEKAPDSVLCTPTKNKGMVFTNDRGKEYCFGQDGLNIWRSRFDGWLAGKAKEAGAKVRDGVTALACVQQDGFVEVNLRGEETYTERARYVLDCEGVIRALKWKATGNVPEFITTFQAFHAGSIDLDPHYFYAYLQPGLSEYDAWFNVKDGLLVLGVSVKDMGKISYYYGQFIAYMQQRHQLVLGRQVKAEKWLMPRIRPGCPVDYGVGRLLFAGEAAGFLNPMGEGISAGMESGYCAATSVMEYFDNPRMARRAYRESTGELKAYMERQWSLVGGLAGTFREME